MVLVLSELGALAKGGVPGSNFVVVAAGMLLGGSLLENARECSRKK